MPIFEVGPTTVNHFMKLWPIILIMLFGSVMPLSANDSPPPSDKMIALLAEEEKAAKEHLSAPSHLIGTDEEEEGLLAWVLLGLASLVLIGSATYWVWGKKSVNASTEVPTLATPEPNSPNADRIPGKAKPLPAETIIPPTPANSKADQGFLTQVQHILDTHIVDPDFNAEAFCIKMNMSKSQFYRKFQDLKGQSPGKYIREKRLEKAFSMLKNGEGNVSEVAYAVGFNNLSYFAKCFRNEFGLPPSHV